MIRPGRDSDADGFIAVTWACWSKYPGIRMDVDAEMPEYRALASYYAGQGGALWTAEAAPATPGPARAFDPDLNDGTVPAPPAAK